MNIDIGLPCPRYFMNPAICTPLQTKHKRDRMLLLLSIHSSIIFPQPSRSHPSTVYKVRAHLDSCGGLALANIRNWIQIFSGSSIVQEQRQLV